MPTAYDPEPFLASYHPNLAHDIARLSRQPMTKYIPKVGKNRWTQLLTDIRQRESETLEILNQLSRVAKNDETKLTIKEAQIKCLQTQLDLEELMKME